MPSMYRRIMDGEFTAKIAYPERKDFQDNDDFRAAKVAYKQAVYDMQHDVFKKAALADLGLIDHPKAHKAWSMAWERGHAQGLHEVYLELQDLAELLID